MDDLRSNGRQNQLLAPRYNISKKKTSASTVVDATFGRKIKKTSAKKFAVRIAKGGSNAGGPGGAEAPPRSVRRTSTYRPYPTPNRTTLIFPADLTGGSAGGASASVAPAPAPALSVAAASPEPAGRRRWRGGDAECSGDKSTIGCAKFI